jgi:hypothetical protein
MADDIRWSLVVSQGSQGSQNGQHYLVALEQVFQVVRREVRHGGGTHTRGYSDQRLSVYELASGELLARKQLGRVGAAQSTGVLGHDGERLWLLGGFAPDPANRATAPRAVFAYEPGDDSWSHITDLPEGVNHAGLAHIDGSLYVVAGIGLNYQRTGDITVAPIRTGVGLRAGASVGYLHYTKRQSWIPF